MVGEQRRGGQASETVTSGGFTGSGTVPFSVTDAFNNKSPATATAITADKNVEMSAIASGSEVDYYKIPMPAAGTRMRVHLTNLSADYDLALYSPTTTSVRTGATNGLPLQDGTIADQSLTLQSGGSNTQLTPTALQDVPDPGHPRRPGLGEPRHRRRGRRHGLARRRRVRHDRRLRLQRRVSPQPYTLRVTTQTPPGITCTPRALTGGTAGTVPTIASLPTNLNTLILVTRSGSETPTVPLRRRASSSSLTHLAGDASLGVSGAVDPGRRLAQAQSTTAWDANPCNVNAANAVANTIANEVTAVKAARPNLKYVVFAGGDDQIPFFRIPDLSLIANESGFAGQFNNNEYYGALASGDLLTDNPYLDTRPVPASGRQLFIPDLAGGRLVETPAQITSAVTSFESSNGTLRNSTAFVSGYDFVSDGSQLVAQRLQSILGASSVRSLIDTTTPFVPATSWSKNGAAERCLPDTRAGGDQRLERALRQHAGLDGKRRPSLGLRTDGDTRLLRRHLPHDGLPRRLPDDRRDHRNAGRRLGAVFRRHRHRLRRQYGLRPRQHGQRRLLRGADGRLRRPSRSHRVDRPGSEPREGGLLPLARCLQLL